MLRHKGQAGFITNMSPGLDAPRAAGSFTEEEH